MATAQPSEFARIASHLSKRRDQMLGEWRRAVGKDPKVSAAHSLVRAQFIDHIPKILDAFERALLARSPATEAAAEVDELAGAAEHGEHRWLHGYNSRETLREWGHLQMCMQAELETLAVDEARIDAAVMREARTMLAQLFIDCMVESAASHAALERAEAAGRLRELERVLEQLRAVERERTELWREAAHDLRGNVGAVKLAANALGHAVSTPELPSFVSLVRKSADSLDTLLSDLIELARLEAGREQRNVTRFNLHSEVGGLCEWFQPLAASRALFLKFEAPAVLVVDGDAVKVRRIAQNLILNALKYTEKGGVTVSCVELPGDVPRWELSVQDTGIGLGGSAAAPLAKVLSAATKEAHAVAPGTKGSGGDGTVAVLPTRAAGRVAAAAAANTAASTGAARAADGATSAAATDGAVTERKMGEPPSEGVGLSIVKRLCELLDASLELESHPGRGTTFRIVFPRHYSA